MCLCKAGFTAVVVELELICTRTAGSTCGAHKEKKKTLPLRGDVILFITPGGLDSYV